MKYTFAILAISLLMSMAADVRAAEKEVLFNGDMSHSGYCEMSMKYTSFNSQPANLLGFSCAWLMNDKFYFGGSAHGSTGLIGGIGSFYYQGGMILGYYYKPNKLYHYSTELFIGTGGLVTLSPFSYTVVEPSVGLNLNLTTFAKLKAGLSYRFVTGTDSSTGLGPNEINAASFYIGLSINPFEIKYPFKEIWNRE